MSNDRVKTGRVGKSATSVGRFTYGVENVAVYQWGEGAALHIGTFCSLARSVSVLLGGNHRVDWITTFPFGHIFEDAFDVAPLTGHPATNGDVVIGNDVWIGQGATILSGVTIGDGAVIAANATVTKDVAPYEIVGGNPAKPLRRRFSDEVIALLLQLRWWELPVETIRSLIPKLASAPTPALLRDLIDAHRVRPLIGAA